jgi:hypothetical protein
MQAAIVDVYTGTVSQVSTFADTSELTTLPDNQRWLTDALWTAAPTVGQIWDSAIPAHFSAPVPMQSMSQAAFAAAIAPQLPKLFAASTQNAAVAHFMVQGLITDPINRSIAFPAMQQLESAGVLTAGTAVSVWGN